MTQTFIILIVLSLAMYVFYKVKKFRTKATVEKQWVQTKANIALGIFMMAFGGNVLFPVRSTIELIVAFVFLIVGFVNVFFGYKAYKHYLPYAIEEAENQKANA